MTRGIGGGDVVHQMANRWPACLSSQTRLAMGTKLGSLGVDLGPSLSRAEQSRATGKSTEYEYWNEQKATGIVEELKTKG